MKRLVTVCALAAVLALGAAACGSEDAPVNPDKLPAGATLEQGRFSAEPAGITGLGCKISLYRNDAQGQHESNASRKIDLASNHPDFCDKALRGSDPYTQNEYLLTVKKDGKSGTLTLRWRAGYRVLGSTPVRPGGDGRRGQCKFSLIVPGGDESDITTRTDKCSTTFFPRYGWSDTTLDVDLK